MEMSALEKWHRSNVKAKVAGAKAKQSRKDNNDLKNAGIYVSPNERYLDEDGYHRKDIEIPTWFKNLSKAWQVNRRQGATRRREKTGSLKSVTEMWDNWCDDRIEMLGEDCDLRKSKPKVGRPKLPPEELKHPKIKRSDKMKKLLKANGINVLHDQSLDKYPDWTFLPNGRVKYENEPPISVHLFLKNINAK